MLIQFLTMAVLLFYWLYKVLGNADKRKRKNG